MGNFSSCTTGFSFSPPSAHTPQSLHVARVLLIDGSMLKFRVPVKVIKLLLDYPNHLICPLDSLKPGLHSLSSLLPDEKLQLGRLYLLLPFKGNLQESCIKSKHVLQQKTNKEFLHMQEREERTRLLPADKSNLGFAASCANFYKKGLYDNKLQSSCSLVAQGEHISKKKAGSRHIEQKNHVKMIKTEVGFQDCADARKNGDVAAGLQYGKRSATSSSSSSYCKVSEKRKGRREMHRYSGKEISNIEKEGPLCNTPELQRAYRSLLRRSSSWTPRLQPILERR